MGKPATLKVDIVADARGVAKGTADANKHFSNLGKTLGALAKVGGVVGALAAVGSVLKTGVSDALAFSQQQRQTAAVLSSTGGAARVTANHVRDLANSIESKSLIDDQAIQSGENLLLTFTNIRNEAGRGNDIFDRTTRVMADLSTALGQDTKTSAIQLGKALNDPIKGVTALQRVGVSFTASQKEQIKTLVDSGHTMQAQKLILGELQKEFGGSAAASAQATGGFVHLKDALQDAVRDGIVKILPLLNQLANWLLTKAWPAVQRVAGELARSLAPTLSQVGTFISTRVVPAIRSLVSWIAGTLVPLLIKSLRPVLAGVQSLFHSVAAAVENNQGSLGKLVTFLRVLVEFIYKYVMPVLGKLIGTSLKLLGVALGTVLTIVSRLIDAVGWLVDKLHDVANLVSGPLSKAGWVLSHIPHSGPPLVGSVQQLVGGVGGVVAPTGQLLTAMAGDPLPGGYSVAMRGLAGAPVVVDRRDMSVTLRVDGALDPVSVGRQLAELLRDHQVRLGAQPAWGAA